MNEDGKYKQIEYTIFFVWKIYTQYLIIYVNELRGSGAKHRSPGAWPVAVRSSIFIFFDAEGAVTVAMWLSHEGKKILMTMRSVNGAPALLTLRHRSILEI